VSKEKTIVLFNQKQVRRHWGDEQGQWFFSVIDVVGVLADARNPRGYWSDLKNKLKQEGSEVYDKIVQLKMQAADGKKYRTGLMIRRAKT